MVRSVNVKKTKSSKKIVLKITMSMTDTYRPLHVVIPELLVPVVKRFRGEESGGICNEHSTWDPRWRLKEPIAPKRKVDTVKADGFCSADVNWEVQGMKSGCYGRELCKSC